MFKIYYEEYRNDYWRKPLEKSFYSLQEIEDWIFGQMRRDYSNKKTGGHAMSFPTPEAAERIKSDGPWEIQFQPEIGSATYWIHQIRDDRGIIFSDGKMTAGKRHWTLSVQDWLTHCKERQYNPTFDFVDCESSKKPDDTDAEILEEFEKILQSLREFKCKMKHRKLQ